MVPIHLCRIPGRHKETGCVNQRWIEIVLVNLQQLLPRITRRVLGIENTRLGVAGHLRKVVDRLLCCVGQIRGGGLVERGSRSSAEGSGAVRARPIARFSTDCVWINASRWASTGNAESLRLQRRESGWGKGLSTCDSRRSIVGREKGWRI